MQMWSILRLAIVAAMISVACTSTSTTPPGSSVGTSPSAGPVDPRLRTLTIGVSLEGQTFDPHVNVAAITAYRFYPNVYESLVQFGLDGKVMPMLAETWAISDDARTYTFDLRSGVKFSDGTPFDAEAVVQSFERFRKIGKGPVALFQPVESVRAVADLVVEFKLSQPYAPILAVLASWEGALWLSPAAVEANEKDGDLGQGWLTDHSAGTGPFVISSWEPNVRLVLTRNSHYREPLESDAIERVVYTYTAEPGTLRQQLETGDLDIAEQITPALIEPLERAEGVEVEIDVTHAVQVSQTLFLNLAKEPLNNADFRRALAHAIDYERLETVWNGIASRAHGPFPQTFVPWFSADHAVQHDYDLAKARDYLSKAGLSAPISPELRFKVLWQAGQTAQRDMAQLIAEDWAKLGIQLDITEVTVPVWRDEVFKHRFEMAFIQAPIRNPDPDSLMKLYVHSSTYREGGFNPGIRDPQIDDLIDRAAVTADPEIRRTHYNEIQRLLTENAYALWLVNKKYAWAHGNNVTGIVWNPVYGPFFRAHEIRKTSVRGG